MSFFLLFECSLKRSFQWKFFAAVGSLNALGVSASISAVMYESVEGVDFCHHRNTLSSFGDLAAADGREGALSCGLAVVMYYVASDACL
jgi:hypothetical protein